MISFKNTISKNTKPSKHWNSDKSSNTTAGNLLFLNKPMLVDVDFRTDEHRLLFMNLS